MKEQIEKAIKSLVAKAENAHDSNDSLKFSQAATNIANAYATMQHANKT